MTPCARCGVHLRDPVAPCFACGAVASGRGPRGTAVALLLGLTVACTGTTTAKDASHTGTFGQPEYGATITDTTMDDSPYGDDADTDTDTDTDSDADSDADTDTGAVHSATTAHSGSHTGHSGAR